MKTNVLKLEKTARKYEMKISTSKTKTLAFKGKKPARSEIVLGGKIIKQVNCFKYLGVNISYNGEQDIQSKLIKS